MKQIIVLFLLLLPAALQAQSIGKVKYGDAVFSTGLPADIDKYYDRETGEWPKMSKERRETAIECIEWTFGKVASYKEEYDACQGSHIFTVILTSGDKISFEDGCLGDYTIVSSRFLVAADMFVDGLRVGEKPNMECKEGVILRQGEDNPSLFNYYWEKSDSYGHFTLDEDGRIKEIDQWFNAC